MINRPTDKELRSKLWQARTAISNGQVKVVNLIAVASDALDLGYCIDKELHLVLAELVELATTKDYVGTHPPMRSYEMAIKGCELIAFSVCSRRFGCNIYFKYTLQDGCLWLASLHRDKPHLLNKG